jgi:uroporphyrinogen decarboxylase
MNNEERVLNLFLKKDVDFLPSQITFSDVTRHAQISQMLGLSGPEELDGYLQNHIALTFMSDDIPLFYRNDVPTLQMLEEKGYCKVDWDNNICYDNWGMGIRMYCDGFFTCYAPLAGDSEQNKRARKFLPERLWDVIDMPLRQAVKKYTAPDPFSEHNFDWFERDQALKGDFMVIPSGYFGIYERGYATLGFENFMLQMADDPETIETLLTKIADYRIAVAHKKEEYGFRVCHIGDDLGTQCAGFFSPDMFESLLLPQYKRLFAAHKKYGHFMIIHSCGNIMQYLPSLIEAGLNGWEPLQPCNDLRTVKKEFGRDLVLWGGIDTQTLPFLSVPEVKNLAREVISILGKGGGHIIAPAQEIMNDVPLENVAALLETIVEQREKVLHE